MTGPVETAVPEPVRGGSYMRCTETHSLTCVEGPGALQDEAVADETAQPAAVDGGEAGSQE